QSMELLSEIPAHFISSVLRLSFVGESGVDAGGLHREWFLLVSEALANSASGVFTCTNEGEQSLYLNANSASAIGDEHLMYFHAAGRFIGRALLEGTALGFHLSTPLLKLILGLPLSFRDVEHFDPEVHKSLLWLLENDGVDVLGLDFSVTVRRGGGASGGANKGVPSAGDSSNCPGKSETMEFDLVPNGRNIPVTDANKALYVERKWQFLLVESVSSQLHVFLKGLYEVLPHEQLLLFDPEELDFVLCGSSEIDVDDWERSTTHSESLSGEGHLVKTWFWEVVREMPNEYRRRLLQFATGSDRVPLSGFCSLTSHDGRICAFTLNGVPLARGEYIWSHACFNQLDVPLYESRSKLRAVLYGVLDTELHGFTTA
ncbi:Hect e3 ubiquitin ligase, partial [Globisporangium polare]